MQTNMGNALGDGKFNKEGMQLMMKACESIRCIACLSLVG